MRQHPQPAGEHEVVDRGGDDDAGVALVGLVGADHHRQESTQEANGQVDVHGTRRTVPQLSGRRRTSGVNENVLIKMKSLLLYYVRIKNELVSCSGKL